MLDLKKLEILVDNALANETESTLIEWLYEQNNMEQPLLADLEGLNHSVERC